jgi:hypothetical protein
MRTPDSPVPLIDAVDRCPAIDVPINLLIQRVGAHR